VNDLRGVRLNPLCLGGGRTPSSPGVAEEQGKGNAERPAQSKKANGCKLRTDIMEGTGNRKKRMGNRFAYQKDQRGRKLKRRKVEKRQTSRNKRIDLTRGARTRVTTKEVRGNGRGENPVSEYISVSGLLSGIKGLANVGDRSCGEGKLRTVRKKVQRPRRVLVGENCGFIKDKKGH